METAHAGWLSTSCNIFHPFQRKAKKQFHHVSQQFHLRVPGNCWTLFSASSQLCCSFCSWSAKAWQTFTVFHENQRQGQWNAPIEHHPTNGNIIGFYKSLKWEISGNLNKFTNPSEILTAGVKAHVPIKQQRDRSTRLNSEVGRGGKNRSTHKGTLSSTDGETLMHLKTLQNVIYEMYRIPIWVQMPYAFILLWSCFASQYSGKERAPERKGHWWHLMTDDGQYGQYGQYRMTPFPLTTTILRHGGRFMSRSQAMPRLQRRRGWRNSWNQRHRIAS